MMKKKLMTFIYRIQQSQAIISMIFWAATLTLLSYQYVGWRLEESFGSIYLAMLALFMSVFLLVFTIGFFFDAVFKLWKEQSYVAYERNPFMKETLFPQEILRAKHVYIPLLRCFAENNPNAKKEIEFLERWIKKSMEVDVVKREVERGEKWILEEEIKEISSVKDSPKEAEYHKKEKENL